MTMCLILLLNDVVITSWVFVEDSPLCAVIICKENLVSNVF